MRESNFAFPAQNRASVCISSQLYDRRALDTDSSLPLFNSLTHLTYLTSTSPRIREIMTYDGGLERLVHLLREFCLSPPPPENAALIYGLAPPPTRPNRRPPALNPPTFDKHAAYRFSLAFQSVVNIGVRGSEEIRARVVQAGTLDVVGCVLEAWLASKGFAVGPSSSATGLPRETREQRNARRAAQAEARSRQRAAEFERALRREVEPNRRHVARLAAAENQQQLVDTPTEGTPSDTDNSANATPAAGTPTGVVTVPGRERSGTVVGRTVWDQDTEAPARGRRPVETPEDTSGDTSRAETETEDDGDIDMSAGSGGAGSNSPSPARGAPMRPPPAPHGRHVVGIVSDLPEVASNGNAAAAAATTGDGAHIVLDSEVMPGNGVGVAQGLVSFEQNDDLALGAPPGAPGAIETATPRTTTGGRRAAPDITPRAIPASLPAGTTPAVRPATISETATVRGQTPLAQQRTLVATTPTTGPLFNYANGAHHAPVTETGPYRDEDVLLGLQLLAYLSKYPHVRQAFYKPCTSFHPATAQLGQQRQQQQQAAIAGNAVAGPSSLPVKEAHGFFKVFAPTRKERTKTLFVTSTSSTTTTTAGAATATASDATGTQPPPQPLRQTNVFSLVERFTFRPSSSESEMPNAPPTLPPEIQYWAGVIMRNACRKDDSRGGIRQCANMLCGKWESFPREFAKCRRCRKAKYCGKECQSTAWSEGHRFWCSAKDNDDHENEHARASHARGTGESSRAAAAAAAAVATTIGGTTITITGPNEGEAGTDGDVVLEVEDGDAAVRRRAPPRAGIPINVIDVTGDAAMGTTIPITADVPADIQPTWEWHPVRRMARIAGNPPTHDDLQVAAVTAEAMEDARGMVDLLMDPRTMNVGTDDMFGSPDAPIPARRQAARIDGDAMLLD